MILLRRILASRPFNFGSKPAKVNLNFDFVEYCLWLARNGHRHRLSPDQNQIGFERQHLHHKQTGYLNLVLSILSKNSKYINARLYVFMRKKAC